jgi:predicted DNA-binding ribbon-helix-helix protein
MKAPHFRLWVLLVVVAVAAIAMAAYLPVLRRRSVEYKGLAELYQIEEEYYKATLDIRVEYLADLKRHRELATAALIPRIDAEIGKATEVADQARIGLDRYRMLRMQNERAAGRPYAYGGPTETHEAVGLRLLTNHRSLLPPASSLSK